MKRTILMLVCAMLIVGFAISCTSSSSVGYRPAGSTAAAWQVQGKWNQASGTVTITIDGKEVISGKPGIFSSSKTLDGDYQGHKVMAILTKATSFLGQDKMHCVITIDGEVAANFDW